MQKRPLHVLISRCASFSSVGHLPPAPCPGSFPARLPVPRSPKGPSCFPRGAQGTAAQMEGTAVSLHAVTRWLLLPEQRSPVPEPSLRELGGFIVALFGVQPKCCVAPCICLQIIDSPIRGGCRHMGQFYTLFTAKLINDSWAIRVLGYFLLPEDHMYYI